MKKIYSSFDFEDYMDDARDGIECDDVSEDEITDEAIRLCNQDWEDFYLPVLERYFDSHVCVVSGSLGLWDGVRHGGVIIESSRDFWKLLDDCWDVEIYDDDGVLVIEGCHHDGRNIYNIKELTDAGYEYYSNCAWVNGDTISYLFDHDFNSKKTSIEWCF